MKGIESLSRDCVPTCSPFAYAFADEWGFVDVEVEELDSDFEKRIPTSFFCSATPTPFASREDEASRHGSSSFSWTLPKTVWLIY